MLCFENRKDSLSLPDTKLEMTFRLATFSVMNASRLLIRYPRSIGPSCPSLKKNVRVPALDIQKCHRRLIFTSVSTRQENRNHDYQPKKELPCLMNHPTHIIWSDRLFAITQFIL